MSIRLSRTEGRYLSPAVHVGDPLDAPYTVCGWFRPTSRRGRHRRHGRALHRARRKLRRRLMGLEGSILSVHHTARALTPAEWRSVLAPAPAERPPE